MNPLYTLILVFIANILTKDHRKSHASRLRKPVQDVFMGTDENQNAAGSSGSAVGNKAILLLQDSYLLTPSRDTESQQADFVLLSCESTYPSELNLQFFEQIDRFSSGISP